MMTFLINLLKKTQNSVSYLKKTQTSVPYTVKYSEWCVKKEKLLADN